LDGVQGVGGSNPLAPTNFQFYDPEKLSSITLYVLKGKSGKRYIGITNNLSRRLKEHRSHKTKGGQLIDDFIVVYTETFPDYQTARIKEKFLKSGQGRKWLDKL
jgi:putative endonuclease